MSVDAFVEAAGPWLARRRAPWPPERFDEAVFRAMAPLVQERIGVLGEVPGHGRLPLPGGAPGRRGLLGGGGEGRRRPGRPRRRPGRLRGRASGRRTPCTAPPRRSPTPWAGSSTRCRRRSGWRSPAAGWGRPYSSPWRSSGARLYWTPAWRPATSRGRHRLRRGPAQAGPEGTEVGTGGSVGRRHGARSARHAVGPPTAGDDRTRRRRVLRRHRRPGVADVAPPRRPTGPGHRGHGGGPVRRDPRRPIWSRGCRTPTTCGGVTWPPPWWSPARKRRATSSPRREASAAWLEQHGVPARRRRRGGRRRLVDQPVGRRGCPAPAGHDQGPDRHRRIPRGPQPGHRLQRRTAGLAGARPPTPRSRDGPRSRTTPRRRWGWPWAGSSATRASHRLG